MTHQPPIPACLRDDTIRQQPAQMVTRKIRQDGNKEGILVYVYTPVPRGDDMRL